MRPEIPPPTPAQAIYLAAMRSTAPQPALSQLYAELIVPLPKKKLNILPTDTIEMVCKKIDKYFDDIIGRYSRETKFILRQMYYKDYWVTTTDLLEANVGGWCEIKRSQWFEVNVAISSAYNNSPITHRLIKIHEIAVHAGQQLHRVEQVGYGAFIRELPEFMKFTEQSAALTEKILFQALPNSIIRKDLSLFSSLFSTKRFGERLYLLSEKETSFDDHVHLRHRGNHDKLTSIDHEAFFRNPDVDAFLKNEVRHYFPEASEHLSTEIYRTALEEFFRSSPEASAEIMINPSGEIILGERIPWYKKPVPERVTTGVKIVGRALMALGFVVDGANLYFAYQRSEKTNDSSHIVNEATRVAGGWTGAISLGKACASAGGFYLAPLGPWGEFVGLVGGGLLGSVAGYLAGSCIAPDVRDLVINAIKKVDLSSMLLPAIFSSQLHGETNASRSDTTEHHDDEDHKHPPEEELKKRVAKDAIKVDFQHPPKPFTMFLKKATFVGNAMEVHQRTTEEYPDAHPRFNAACSVIQVGVEEFIKEGAAAVAASAASVPTVIPNPGSAVAAAVAHDAAKPIAKKIGNAVNDGLHYVFGTPKPRAATAHPSRRLTASNQYEQHISRVNSSVRHPAESHRKYFAKMGMPEKNVFGQGGGEGIRVHGHLVSDAEFTKTRDSNRSQRSFFVDFIQSRMPVATASAETCAKSVAITRSQAQPTSQHSAEYYESLQKQFLNEDISSSATTTANTQPKTAISHTRTNTATHLLNTTQLSDLKISLQKTNVALRERQEAAQVAQYNAQQRQVETLSLAGEVCSLASRVCRYCGDDDTAQFFSSTFSLYSAFFTLIAMPSPLSVLGVLMPFLSFFVANRAAEEARRFAMMIAAASRSVENMRDDVITEIREFQRLAQYKIRLVGAKVSEVLAAQNQLHQSQTEVFSGLAVFQKSLGEYFEKTNAYMHVLATRNLKTACDDLLSYLDRPTETIAFTLSEIKKNLHQLKFWIESRLHHPVMNYTVYLNLPESEIISILSSQPHTLFIMPSFVAGRAQIALREKVLPKFLSLPPMMPYFTAIRLLFRTLEKHPEFLMDDKFADTFKQIQETLTTFSELLTLLKNNESDIPSDILSMVREVDLYQAVIAEMKRSVTDYQKRLHYLTDPLQQLDMFAREFFDKPNSQNGFWKKHEAKSNQTEVCYVISRSHFYDDPQDANTEVVRDSEREFLNKFSRRRIKVMAVTINHEGMFQVILPAKSVPNILPSIPNKCASFFFNAAHQRDLIPEMASSTSTARFLQ